MVTTVQVTLNNHSKLSYLVDGQSDVTDSVENLRNNETALLSPNNGVAFMWSDNQTAVTFGNGIAIRVQPVAGITTSLIAASYVG